MLKNTFKVSISLIKLSLIIIIVPITSLFVACDSDPASSDIDRYDWKYSTPEDQNMNPQLLNLAKAQADLVGYFDGLLVIRNGFLVAEDYYNGYDRNSPHNIMSVSKSFLSVITGIAHHQGHIENLDQKMLAFFPEYHNLSMDENMNKVTIRHLLTMQMGIDSESDRGYALYSQIYHSANWIQTTLELPLVFNPGESMLYNTFQTHLLSAIITKATEKSTLKYAQDNMCRHMGIDIDDWEQGPQGYYFGGNSMHFTPREMATLGLLYLNGGRLNDVQIVPSSWVDLSLTKTWEQDGSSWGVLTDFNYGYLWWLGKINGYELWMALGYGGQTVLVFPELDLIVVTTAEENVASANEQEMAVLSLVAGSVLTAVNN